MGQLPHLEVGDTPTDITEGLEPGCYVGQVRQYGDQGLLVATSPTVPADDLDYFLIGGRLYFAFTADDGEPPTWVKSSVSGKIVAVALARVP